MIRHEPASDGLVTRGPDASGADLTVVAVHGRDQSPSYLLEHLVEQVADPSIAWLLPAAAGCRWWSGSFMDPSVANGPVLESARARVAALVDRSVGIDPARVVWLGFSQGACLVAEIVARQPRRWGGLVVMAGGRMGPHGVDLAIDGDLGGMPVLVCGGARDRWVPVGRVHETADAFRSAGAAVTVAVFDDADHRIRAAEVAGVVDLCERVRWVSTMRRR